MEVWRRCMGLCCVCGVPMACPQSALRFAAVHDDDDDDDDGGGGDAGGGVVPIDSDARLLTEEEPTRLTLLRFNALGDYQFAHVVDDYTFLEKRRNKVSFRSEFAKHKALVVATHPEAMACFEATVLDGPNQDVYIAGVGVNRRVAEGLTVPCCRYCNKAMDREGAHVLATYRCFELTRDSDVPLLESTSKEAIAAKKVVQQIAFYFKVSMMPALLLPKTGKKKSTATNNNVVVWAAKTEDQLLRDASMWRCIAHLWNWGRSEGGGGVRFRMVAVFHVTYYIYLQSRARDVVSFEAWHVHCWRPYYMTHFAADSFLGMRQAEAGSFFDLSRKNGEVWQERVHARAMQVMDDLEAFTSPQELESVVRYEVLTTGAAIHSEGALLRFLLQSEVRRRRQQQQQPQQCGLRCAPAPQPLPHWLEHPAAAAAASSSVAAAAAGAPTAVALWLRFFRYNLSSVPTLQAPCEKFARELSKTLQSGGGAPPRPPTTRSYAF